MSKTYFSAMSELRKLRCLETRGKQKESEGFCTCSLQEVWILQYKGVYPNKKENTGHKATGSAQTKANRNLVLQHLLMEGEWSNTERKDLAKVTKNCSCLTSCSWNCSLNSSLEVVLLFNIFSMFYITWFVLALIPLKRLLQGKWGTELLFK